MRRVPHEKSVTRKCDLDKELSATWTKNSDRVKIRKKVHKKSPEECTNG